MNRKRWLLLPPAIWISCLFLIQLLGGIAAPASSEMPSQCPEDSRNCAQTMMVFDGSPEAVHSAAMDWIQSQSRTSMEQESELSSHAVFRTKWLMFQDDFFIESGCTANQTWLQVHSESRLGIGDMGVNQNRIDAMLDHLATIEFEVGNC
jgi:uncharacterized protein (DUF1499 family)